MTTTYGLTHRSIGRSFLLIALATFALAGTACSKGTTATPNPGPSTPAPAIATATAVPTAISGPMTGDELLWLEGIAALHKDMDNFPSVLTPDTMRSLADKRSGCSRTLDAQSSLTDRLRPVHDLAKQGCTQYEKSAECFKTAANVGVIVAGSAEEKRHKEAIDCALAASGEGSKLFAEAEIEGSEVKEAAR